MKKGGRMIRLIKKVFEFAVNVVKSMFIVVSEFITESVQHAPAITILVFATIGLAGTIAILPLEVAFAPVPFISEAMVVPVLSMFTVWLLATIAGRTAQQTY